MGILLLIIIVIAGLSACSRPTAPSDTDQQQGNAQAQPEKNATSKSNHEPGDNQAGRDAHNGIPTGNTHP